MFAAFAVILLAADGALSLSETSSADGKIVYGVDNRRDVYQLPQGDALRELAEKSIVCLFRTEDIGSPNNGVYDFLSGPYVELGNTQNPQMCSDQRFVRDPAMAFCSGTLIAPDRVLTAGHCINKDSCSTISFVFKYYVTGRDGDGVPSFPAITDDDVYTCRNVYSFNDQSKDFAVVQLDRSVDSSKQPADIESQPTTYNIGKQLVLIGCPTGIPIKIADDAQITQAQGTDFFNANTDSFAGNSGSGVFAADSEKAIGILVRGGTDYVTRTTGGASCTEVNTVPNLVTDSEACTYAYHHTEVIDCKSDSECSGTRSTCDRSCASDSDECTGFCRQIISPSDHESGTIAFSQLVRGSTDGNDNNFGNPNGDAVYRIQVDQAGEYIFLSCGSNFDTVLSILDENGTLLQSCDDITDTESECQCTNCCVNTQNTALRVNLTPGEIRYLLIEGFGASGEGDYRVRMTTADPCPRALPLIIDNCGEDSCPVSATNPTDECCDAALTYSQGNCEDNVSSEITVPSRCTESTVNTFSEFSQRCSENSAGSASSLLAALCTVSVLFSLWLL